MYIVFICCNIPDFYIIGNHDVLMIIIMMLKFTQLPRPNVYIRAETNTRFARVFARLHKYSDTKRGIRIYIYIDFLHYFLHFL